MKKTIRFMSILSVLFVFWAYIGRIFFKFFWNFDIFSSKHYLGLYQFWEKGGVFKSFKDISLILCLIILPIVWIKTTKRFYKQGFWKSVLSPVIKIYKKLSYPKNLEVEHVSIKNLGAKDRSLEEIISDKLKEKGESTNQKANTTQNLREQVSAKLKENENK